MAQAKTRVFSAFLALTCFGTTALALAGLWFFRPTSIGQFSVVVLVTYLLVWFPFALTEQISPRKTPLRFLLCSLSILFVIACLEGAAFGRVIDYRVLFGTFSDEPWRNPVNRLDPELLHVRKPNLAMKFTQRGGDISFYADVPDPSPHEFDVQFDKDGFRNKKELAATDIIVVGDSFIESDITPYDHLMTTVLSRFTGKTVLNLGQLWYGPQQELVVLKRFGLVRKPKVCVWAFFEGNDLSDFRRYESVKKDWDRISARFDSARDRSFLVNAMQVAFKRLGKAPAKEPPNLGEVVIRGKSVGDLYFYYPGKPLDAQDLSTLAKTSEIFRDALYACKREEVDFIVAFVPSKFRVYHDLCKFPEGSKCLDWRPSDLNVRLAALLREVSPEIGFIDLTDSLRNEAETGKLVYLRDDTHWSIEGNAAAAKGIADFLENRSKTRKQTQ